MSKIIFEVGISLDGFIAGPNGGPDNPLGHGGPEIHEWMYELKSWRERARMEGVYDSSGPYNYGTGYSAV